MKKEIIFLTGNQDKINSAREVFKDFPEIVLKVKQIDLPEIQSLDVKEVAEHFVERACNKLNASVFKTDCGYYFEALNNFPGALIRYFNEAISVEVLLDIFKGRSRKVTIQECLSFCKPGQKPVSFVTEIEATMAYEPEGQGNAIDRLMIHPGFAKPQAACDYDEIVSYWNKELTHYKDLALYLKSTESV